MTTSASIRGRFAGKVVVITGAAHLGIEGLVLALVVRPV
jgi:hypothetical protein